MIDYQSKKLNWINIWKDMCRKNKFYSVISKKREKLKLKTQNIKKKGISNMLEDKRKQIKFEQNKIRVKCNDFID